MKKYFLFLLQIVFALAIVSCSDKDDPIPPKPKPEKPKINPVSQFAYDGMSVYYKWADQMIDKKPTYADTDPEKYFYSLRSQPDIDHGWSWITDDVEGLLKGFSGESFSFGYDLLFTRFEDNKVYAFIKYVFPNTPASEAGMERLHLIGEINGSPISIEKQNGKSYIAKKDLDVLFGNNQATFTLYKIEGGVAVKDKDVMVTPRKIDTNPVLKDSIYTVGDKTIGYLFYTDFISNFNEELFKSFSKFKSAGVNELVLDLRYNRGGAISSASYLASMIAPASAVENKEILSTLSYNDNINALFDKKGWSRSSRLGNYNNEGGLSNPLEANLNLSKVYIIATDGSYSASELTAFCLKSYMEVIHIGNKTGGKYTASWTLHPYDSFSGRAQAVYDEEKLSAENKKVLKNWAMQPIVAVYTNKNGETFMKTDGLIPEPQNMFEKGEGFGYLSNWTKLGDTKDTFLGQAFYLITGDEKYKPVEPAATKAYSPVLETIEFEPVSLSDKIQQESVIIDNTSVSPGMMQELMEK